MEVAKIASLVELLHVVVLTQYQDVQRSLLGMGDYILDKDFERFTRSRKQWCTMTQEKKDRIFRKFLEQPKDVNSCITHTKESTKPVLTPTHHTRSNEKEQKVPLL